ncbi:endonuclease/exonuclease/phosphatase family protein [Thioalkalivibrio sp. AKL10]|uniref:endonuclease/exonuclease/phosphatase family protein n=1 Tax=Thioalkalivibrio sp. AKL10 TaxID=1158158 RepID=UPI0009D9E38E|nr:endonuclease/exonuclease/phosphatase family protein [Thioalkalivibrio sp. AKL10]
MRLVSWNCNGALRNKLDAISRLDADVLVVQECEDPAHSTPAFHQWAGNYLWAGESRHKGIGIFPRNGHSVRALHWSGNFQLPGLSGTSPALEWATNDLKLFLPFVLDENQVFIAVWTKGSNQQAFRYIGQFWKYLQIHREQIRQHQAVIVGDFNSNTVWDRPDQWWNHTDVVSELEAIGLRSLYHHQFDESQGGESQATFYLQRNANKPYHIDYAFVPHDQLAQSAIEIGYPTDYWLKVSDHMPLLLTWQDMITKASAASGRRG